MLQRRRKWAEKDPLPENWATGQKWLFFGQKRYDCLKMVSYRLSCERRMINSGTPWINSSIRCRSS